MVGTMNFGWRLEPSRQRRRNGVADLGVGEPLFNQLEILFEHDARHRRQNRDDFLVRHLGKKGADQRMLHRLMHEVDVQQPGRIGDDGMAAIEDADLHVRRASHP